MSAKTEMRVEHNTKGPWTVKATFPDPERGHTFEPVVSVCGLYEGKPIRLADIPDVASRDTEEYANACLIAAAPDLLAALKGLLPEVLSILNTLEGKDDDLESAYQFAHAQVAKAEGQ
jgi:hypothetical protein